ncbi:MAG: TatD family hydrolase [Clostridium sp.]|nr:TatD family hydrolase [Clostridium sp.]MCM1460764.1 TatD family hydrolase [Bacteroides sp.]
MYKIFETHAHFDDDAFDEDRNELLLSMKNNGIEKLVNIGASLASCEHTLQLMECYDFIYGAIGVHPSDVSDLENYDGGEAAAIDALRQMALANEKVVAIGEIGLDYHYDDTDKEMQKKWFVKQMELAGKLKLPIVVHSRDAAADTVDIMKENHAEQLGGVIHCYSYTKELAKTFLDMGFFFGIGGVITFKNARKLVETVEYLPLEHIVLETDSPYLAPEPYRGKRNSSLNLPYVAETIAKIKQISVEDVYRATWDNAMHLYHMDRS